MSDGVPFFSFSLGAAYWRDVGNPAAYRQAQLDLLRGCVATRLRPAGTERDGCWIGPGARLDPSARLTGPAAIGADTEVAAGARVGPFAVIGAGARIEGAVLWEGVEVGEGAVLCDCIVVAHAVVGTHAQFAGGVVLESPAVIPGRAEPAHALPRAVHPSGRTPDRLLRSVERRQ